MIIPFFIMNRGCPHRCLFCNERLTAGDRPERIEETAFTETVRAYLGRGRRTNRPCPDRLLRRDFHRYGAKGAEPSSRTCSALSPGGGCRRHPHLDAPRRDRRGGPRPPQKPWRDDCRAGRAVARRRGPSPFAAGPYGSRHLPGNVPPQGRWASRRGFISWPVCRETAEERFAETIDKTIALHPDTVRIHPTIVLRDTLLADAFREGTL